MTEQHSWYRLSSIATLEVVKDASGNNCFKVGLKEGVSSFQPREFDVAIRVEGELGYLADEHDYDMNYHDVYDSWCRIEQQGIYAEEEEYHDEQE
jgi:hypothetical protein